MPRRIVGVVPFQICGLARLHADPAKRARRNFASPVRRVPQQADQVAPIAAKTGWRPSIAVSLASGCLIGSSLDTTADWTQ